MSPLAARLLAVALAVAAVYAGSPPPCTTFLQPLIPCMSYITGYGPSVPVPAPCCEGVKSLAGMMTTPAERVAGCKCFKDAIKRMLKGVDHGRVSALPGRCHVQAPFNFSLDVHCDTIKAAAADGPEAEEEHL